LTWAGVRSWVIDCLERFGQQAAFKAAWATCQPRERGAAAFYFSVARGALPTGNSPVRSCCPRQCGQEYASVTASGPCRPRTPQTNPSIARRPQPHGRHTSANWVAWGCCNAPSCPSMRDTRAKTFSRLSCLCVLCGRVGDSAPSAPSYSARTKQPHRFSPEMRAERFHFRSHIGSAKADPVL
jgi:hypothetical protein